MNEHRKKIVLGAASAALFLIAIVAYLILSREPAPPAVDDVNVTAVLEPREEEQDAYGVEEEALDEPIEDVEPGVGRRAVGPS